MPLLGGGAREFQCGVERNIQPFEGIHLQGDAEREDQYPGLAAKKEISAFF